MKLVIFGLTISSSWGNGHATLWRGLCRALLRRGHRIVFYERDVPYYADHRDLHELPSGGRIRLYGDWSEVAEAAARDLDDADAAIVTSYCPDGVAASGLVLASRASRRVFYDLDTPVTLARLSAGQSVEYIGPRGLGDFDLVLSYTGGAALNELKTRLGARRTAPLYGFVDPEVHRPVPPAAHYLADLSYLGTYAEDRQEALEGLFIAPARRLPEKRFVIGGAQYPAVFPWAENIHFVRHLPPGEHPAFFSSSRLTLNVTRRSMAAMGFCPSGRMFEAAACGAPLISDWWDGLDAFFEPGGEILIAHSTEGVMDAMAMSDAERAIIGHRARERTLEEHTAEHRASLLLTLLNESGSPERGSAAAVPLLEA
jgi:spore maturation protein CgeB